MNHFNVVTKLERLLQRYEMGKPLRIIKPRRRIVEFDGEGLAQG